MSPSASNWFSLADNEKLKTLVILIFAMKISDDLNIYEDEVISYA
jgi:hypothetical protein